jgi:trans-aconitate 2-methyltransferase
MPSWDENQYLKFADERTRPARELLARVPLASAQHVLDLGCGPGNSTALLRQRYPDARLTGVDSSAEMLARARQEDSKIEWIQVDASHFAPHAALDLSFSNAALQWLPDHERLVPKLLAQVRPGGVLAFQVPCNFAEPSHRLMRELAGPWADRVAALGRARPVREAAAYYDLLAPHAQSVDIWQTRYEHVLADAPAIVEWVKGTGLRPFLEALSVAERPHYLDAYTQAIAAAYPARADGKRLFSFPRLFVVALR